jgi:hypothetical protein
MIRSDTTSSSEVTSSGPEITQANVDGSGATMEPFVIGIGLIRDINLNRIIGAEASHRGLSGFESRKE